MPPGQPTCRHAGLGGDQVLHFRPTNASERLELPEVVRLRALEAEYGERPEYFSRFSGRMDHSSEDTPSSYPARLTCTGCPSMCKSCIVLSEVTKESPDAGSGIAMECEGSEVLGFVG